MNFKSIICLVGSCALIFGCSVKKDAEPILNSDESIIKPIVVTPNGDIDGDGVTNQKEQELGRNPFLAETPELQVRFLQNYGIKFKAVGKAETEDAGKIKELEINTLVGRDDPDFKYKVGNIFARHNTYKVLANIGRFSGHTWGDINDHDFSWIKYPDIDPTFYHQMMIQSRPYVRNENYDIKDIAIELENTIRVKSNGIFKEIKNVEVSFYYYNYKNESYDLIKSEIIKRHFKSGITETFKVNIANAPLELLIDNYLTKGEFIISEITNYEIPELEIDYKTYISRIKRKSVPVIFNTPQETNLYYVGVNGEKDRFLSILERIFPKKVTIQDNKLTKVEQFENNLDSYVYLKEIRDKDKNGQWFILTNKLTQHYLDHGYSPKDRIIISYITGKELASQKDETIYSFRTEVYGGEHFELYPIGNVSPNSKIDIQFMPLRRFGQTNNHITEILDIPMHDCGHNCVNPGVYCHWEINVVKDYDEAFSFNKTLGGDVSKIELIINESSYALVDLLNEEKMSVRWPKNGNLHITINDIDKIQKLRNFDTNLVQIKVRTDSNFDFWGIKLVAVDRAWSGMGGCGFQTPAAGSHFGTRYISKESIHFREIQTTYDHIIGDEGRRYHILKEADTMYQKIKVRMSSTIQNFYN